MVTAAYQEYEMRVVKMNLELALRRMYAIADDEQDPARLREWRQRIIELQNLIDRL